MNFLEVISAVANLLTALSVTAHFFHSAWKCRPITSGSVRMGGTLRESEGTPTTGEEEPGRELQSLE